MNPNRATDGRDDLRPLLFSIAYEMLGTVADAEDIVQEAFLRLERAEQAGTIVQSARAYLTTVTARLAIDELRSARVRRETYVGPWLPEPLVAATEPDPAQAAEIADSLSLSFLVLLEALTPVERAVFLLREVFDFEYEEISSIVSKTEPNCRQIFSRATKRIRGGKPRFAVDREQHRQLASRFVEVLQGGDIERFVELLSADVVFTRDGGGKGTGLPRPVHGRDRVIRLLHAFQARWTAIGGRIEQTTINGQPGTLNFDVDGRLINVLAFDIADGTIQAISSIVNPDKLRHLGYELSSVGRRRASR
jgi:RNA polymerase sigma-70 factor (ECF subfamily)